MTTKIAPCVYCGLEEMDVYADPNAKDICVDCAETSLVSPCCETPKDGTAARVVISRARLSGDLIATCSACLFVCAYWECACELVHECEGN